MADKTETKDKAAKFKELAVARVNKAIAAISTIGNLANKANYDFTEADVDKITTAIDDANAAIEARFKAVLEGKPVKASGGFTL